MHSKTDFFIDGAWVKAHSDQALSVINPTTEEVIETISLGNETDLNLAVAAAKKAQAEWSETSVAERKALLERLLDIYKTKMDDMAEVISSEMGAPIALAKTAQAGAGYGHLRQTIKTLETFEFVTHVTKKDGIDNVFHEAVGVVGLITPWNWPMNQVMLKVAPALAAGCSVVLKPSEIAPLSSMLLTEMIEEAGFPKGVFNLVNGDGAGVGTWLTKHPDVAAISFTGSTRAGRLIMQSASEHVKPICLELGGKGANIIFADADEKAVGRGVRQCFLNSGQSCNAPTRMLVEESMYASAVEQAHEMANKSMVGLAHEEGRHIGPVASATQYEKVQSLISRGIAQGAKLVCGGEGRPDGFAKGYFVKPTVFADVTPEMDIFREEIFGPVLSIIPFKDQEHAIELANDTPYGLTNYVQTGDVDRARHLARKLKSGMVEVNGQLLSPASPFGGVGLSGVGREGGIWGLEEFLYSKAVSGI
ncbi:MAG: aldehyde dehydrogenase family protein [Burkholderiales bacterium]|nr:aldehyde dehydrogenase family protein [Burkholderiales bacterium]